MIPDHSFQPFLLSHSGLPPAKKKKQKDEEVERKERDQK